MTSPIQVNGPDKLHGTPARPLAIGGDGAVSEGRRVEMPNQLMIPLRRRSRSPAGRLTTSAVAK